MCAVVAFGVGDDRERFIAAFIRTQMGFGIRVRVHVRSKAAGARKRFLTYGALVKLDLLKFVARRVAELGHYCLGE